MRTRLAVLALTGLALLAGGCGGSSVAYEEAPGEPVGLTVPQGSEALSSDATRTATPTVTATTDPATGGAAATPAPTTSGSTGGTAPTTTGQSGGTGAPNEEQFDAFCNENPGACD